MTTPYQEREDQLQQLASRSSEHLLRGEFAVGEKVAREFLELAKDTSDDWHSLAQLRLGTILENAGQGAISLCQIAIDSAAEPADKVWALQSEAWLNRDLKQFQQAEKLLAEALSYLDESDEENARTHGMIGVLKKDHGLFTKAEDSFLRSLELSERHGHDKARRVACYSLGCVLQNVGDMVQARHYWQRALELAQNACEEEAAKDLQRMLELYRPSLFARFCSKMPWRRNRKEPC